MHKYTVCRSLRGPPDISPPQQVIVGTQQQWGGGLGPNLGFGVKWSLQKVCSYLFFASAKRARNWVHYESGLINVHAQVRGFTRSTYGDRAHREGRRDRRGWRNNCYVLDMWRNARALVRHARQTVQGTKVKTKYRARVREAAVIFDARPQINTA
eukprot:1196050-Prorocentrum_minimum.AAC.3